MIFQEVFAKFFQINHRDRFLFGITRKELVKSLAPFAKLLFTAQCSHYTESLPLEGKVLSERETDEV